MQTKKSTPVRQRLSKTSSMGSIEFPQKSLLETPQKHLETSCHMKSGNFKRNQCLKNYFNYTPFKKSKNTSCLSPSLGSRNEMRERRSQEICLGSTQISADKLKARLSEIKIKIDREERHHKLFLNAVAQVK